jgi:hypothetical protein
MNVIFVEKIYHADGSEETKGGPFPDLCERCPLHEGRGPWRHVEVVKRY